MAENEHTADKSVTKHVLVFVGDAENPYTLMVEPWGMTYELSGQDRMFVELELPDDELPELVGWPGGVSIGCAGRTVTRDSSGALLHEFG